MKFLVLFCMFFIGLGSYGQIEPLDVKLIEGGRMPAVYALAQSHFTFTGNSDVSEAYVTHGGTQWEIEKFSEGLFKVNCKVYGRSTPVDLDSIVQFLFVLNNGDSIVMLAPITVYAPVKIVPYGSGVNASIDKFNCEEKIGFHAQWVYPNYVKRRWRVMGVFDMAVLKGDDRLMGFSGWYDSGDRTKPQSIAHFSSLTPLEIKVKRIRTLHKYSQNGVPLTIHLSDNHPNEWLVNCD